MTIFRNELKRGFRSLLIWCLSISFLLVICIFMFPEMKNEMDDVSDMFASMGSFTQAFGMDRINFGTLTGFYAVECGNILGLGGAFFASMISISALAGEEKEHTAEFILSHPISRIRFVSEKLLSVMTKIIVMNIIIWLLSVLSIMAIGETVLWKEISLLHISYLILQIEISGICFGISAFINRGSLGIGLGIASMFYFLNIIANISDNAKFLKYITPFGYAEGADIVSSASIDFIMVCIGVCYSIIAIFSAYIKYYKKDITV